MDKLIEEFVELGVTESEARVYLILLTNAKNTATEISKLAKLSRTQTYKILGILIKKNMATEILGKSKSYLAVKPDIVVKKLKDELTKRQHIIPDLQKRLNTLHENRDESKNNSDFIQVLYTPISILNKIESLEDNCLDSIISFNKPPYAINMERTKESEVDVELRENQQKSIKKGIKFKSLYEIENIPQDQFIDKMKSFESLGENVKISKELPFKFAVFDINTTIISLPNQSNNKTNFASMVIKHPGFAKALQTIFNIYWEKSLTIKEYLTKK